jgi:hypothetical protein
VVALAQDAAFALGDVGGAPGGAGRAGWSELVLDFYQAGAQLGGCLGRRAHTSPRDHLAVDDAGNEHPGTVRTPDSVPSLTMILANPRAASKVAHERAAADLHVEHEGLRSLGDLLPTGWPPSVG